MIKVYKFCFIICAACLAVAAGNFVLAGNGFFLEKDSKFYIFDNLQINGYLAAVDSNSQQPGLLGDVMVSQNFILDAAKDVNFCDISKTNNAACSIKSMSWNKNSSSLGLEVINNNFKQISVKKILATDLSLSAGANKTITASSNVKIAKCLSNSATANCKDGQLKTQNLYLDKINPLSLSSLGAEAEGNIKLKDVKFAADFDFNKQNLCWNQAVSTADATVNTCDPAKGRLGFYDGKAAGADWMQAGALTDHLVMNLCTRTDIIYVKKTCDCSSGTCSENCGCQISGKLDDVCEGGVCTETCDCNKIACADGSACKDGLCSDGSTKCGALCPDLVTACVDACPPGVTTCENNEARDYKCTLMFGTDYKFCRVASYDSDGSPNYRCYKQKEIKTYTDKLCEFDSDCPNAYSKCKEKSFGAFYCKNPDTDEFSNRACSTDADCLSMCRPVGYDSLHQTKSLFELKGPTTCCNINLTY